MEEIWKDIPNFDGVYKISNHGRIKSLKNNKERILKPLNNGRDYYYVFLNNKSFSINKLHTLVFYKEIRDSKNK
jgi:hypothetical protein